MDGVALPTRIHALRVGARWREDSKVAGIIEEYSLGEGIERRWTAEDGDGLRDLAALFDRRVLGQPSASTPGAEARDVESTYETLTDDDASAGERQAVRRNMEREGLDVDALTDAFVSHQTVHTYPTGYRGATYPDRTPMTGHPRPKSRRSTSF
jgi:hypothetical protein